jgi:YD repeat-containing protein
MATGLTLLLILCVVIQPIVTSASGKKPFLAIEKAQQQTRNGKARKVPPLPPERSAPALNLPNLDEVRQRRQSEPVIPAPIESTLKSRRKSAGPANRKKSHHGNSRNGGNPHGRTAAEPPPPQNGPPSFTDDPLKDPNNPESFKVKAVHITELRTAINIVRNRYHLADYTWQKPAASVGAINTNVLISWEPIDEMRTALNQAIGPPPEGYTGNLAVGLPILAAHIQELRERVKGILGSSTITDQLVPGNQLQARDAEWSLPLVGLAGRAGLDLGISLSYSSMVWTQAGSNISFDDDNGDPSPGFRLGFPIIQGRYNDNIAGRNVYLFITAAGRRIELRRVGTTNVYEAGDSSYLQLIDNGGSLLLRTTDGTQMSYGRFGSDWHCTQIEDRNGNLILSSYNSFGDLTNVTDTLGRVLTFNYDGNGNLQSITQPWTANGSSQTHTWATFGWGTQQIQPAFSSSLSLVGIYSGETIPVLTQVGLADGSHYNFEYNSNGQVNCIRRYTDIQRVYSKYDYDSSPTTDCPRITAAHVWASNWNGDTNGTASTSEEATTSFVDNHDGSHQMTTPDGTVFKEFYGGSGDLPAWQHGLVTSSQVITGSTVPKTTTVAYTQDNTSVNYQTNPRVVETNVSDGTNHRRTTVDYSVTTYAQYGLPYFVSEYDANTTTEIRRTYTDYNLSQSFLDRRIIGLVSQRHIKDMQTGQFVAKVSYEYDQTTPNAQAADAIMHDSYGYPASMNYRGNVTSVSTWDVNAITTNSHTTTMTYNAAGSLLTTADPAQHTTTISYVDSFSNDGTNAYTPHDVNNNTITTFAYPTTVTDADSYSSTVKYDYDFGSKTRMQGPPPAGQTNGVIQTFAYDSIGRLSRVTNVNNSAYTQYVYGTYYIQSFSSVNAVATTYTDSDAYSFQAFDGFGRVYASAANHPGSTGGFRGQYTSYDVMGRMVQQTNPFEMDGGWTPAGDDAAGYQFNPANTFDWKGRPLKTYNMDGTYKEASYAGCGCAGGEVVTITDEMDRQQKVYSDVLGRQWKTEVLNWPDVNNNRTVYSTTERTLNTRDQATLIRQFQGTDQSGEYQDRTMSYDGYGRLQSKHLPEQRDQSNNPTYTTYDYNTDDTINWVQDGRGVKATYGYNNGRHLLSSITYPDSQSLPAGVAPTDNVSFSYDAAGNRISMNDGSGTMSYGYDELSHITSETKTFNGLSGSYALNYSYNLAGELTSLSIPFTSQSIGYGYDNAGRLSSMSASGFNATYGLWPNTHTDPLTIFISSIAYRAWGAPKNVTYGNTVSESTDYNSRLEPTSYTLNNVDYSNYYTNPAGHYSSMSWTYDYYDDGRVNHAYDSTWHFWDRSYSYDHVGRLTEAYTNRVARGQAWDQSHPDPYKQTWTYDVWNNLNRNGNLYSLPEADNTTYSNNRRSDSSYDANGNATANASYHNTFDVFGANTHMQSTQHLWDGSSVLEISQTYTADGQTATRTQVMRQNEFNETGDLIGVSADTLTSHYIYSSVLRARVVELDQNGNAKDVWVYAGGRRIYANGTFEHHNPVTGSYVQTLAHPLNRVAIRQERDPADAELPLEAPASGGSYVSSKWDQPLFIDGGDPFDFSGGCTQDGIAISCNEAQHNLDRGTAVAALSIGATVIRTWDFTGRGEMGMNFLRSGVRISTWVKDQPDNPEPPEAGPDTIVTTVNGEASGHWEYSWAGLAFGGQRGSKKKKDEWANYGGIHGMDYDMAKWFVDRNYDSCHGSDSGLPGREQTILALADAFENTNWAAEIGAIWSHESGFVLKPDGDAGPAQLTTWWSKNHPEIIVGNSYGSWHGRTHGVEFDGNSQDNLATLRNIVMNSDQRYGSFYQTAYWYGPGDPNDAKNAVKNRKAYAEDVVGRYNKLKPYFDCLHK